jgi:hypothetical protein
MVHALDPGPAVAGGNGGHENTKTARSSKISARFKSAGLPPLRSR